VNASNVYYAEVEGFSKENGDDSFLQKNPQIRCRTFAGISYALLCAVMQNGATDATQVIDKQTNKVRPESYEPGGRTFESCRARHICK